MLIGKDQQRGIVEGQQFATVCVCHMESERLGRRALSNGRMIFQPQNQPQLQDQNQADNRGPAAAGPGEWLELG